MFRRVFSLILVLPFVALPVLSKYGEPVQSAAITLPTIIDTAKTPPDVSLSNPHGATIAGTGDFNGDGHDDLLFSFRPPTIDTISTLSKFSVLFASASSSSSVVDLESAPNSLSVSLSSPSPFGAVSEVSSIPPIFGDRTSEIVLNSITVTGLLSFKEKAIYVISGSSGLKPGVLSPSSLSASLTVIPPVLGTDDYFNLEGAGDVNGDGIPDLVFLTRPPAAQPASISIVLGPFTPGQVIDLTEREPDVVIGPGCFTPIALADVNGDGITDLLVGDRCDSQLEVLLGSARLSGGLHLALNTSTADVVISGVTRLNPYDANPIATGDVNGDGIDDIVVIGQDSQKVCVVFGSASIKGRIVDTSKGQQDFTLTGFSDPSLSGLEIAVNDIDGDGVADILADAPGAAGLHKSDRLAGVVYGVLGSRQLTSGATVDVSKFEQDLTIVGPSPGYMLRLSPVSIDYNLDGVPDIVLANPVSVLGGDRRDISIIFGGPLMPPSITSASITKNPRGLIVSGANFTGAAQVEVNGTVLGLSVDFSPVDGTLSIKGKRRALNLHSGDNQIVVIRKGVRSKTFDLQL